MGEVYNKSSILSQCSRIDPKFAVRLVYRLKDLNGALLKTRFIFLLDIQNRYPTVSPLFTDSATDV